MRRSRKEGSEWQRKKNGWMITRETFDPPLFAVALVVSGGDKHILFLEPCFGDTRGEGKGGSKVGAKVGALNMLALDAVDCLLFLLSEPKAHSHHCIYLSAAHKTFIYSTPIFFFPSALTH